MGRWKGFFFKAVAIGVPIAIVFLVVEGIGMPKEIPTKLHFVVPFSIETYMPMTMENIETDSYEVWIAADHKIVNKLNQTLQLRPSRKTFHEKEIRLKADFGSSLSIFFLDKEGVVLRKLDGERFELTNKELEHVEQLLQEMIGVVDIKAHSRFYENSKKEGQEKNRATP
jgi:hypothetical protein